MAADDDGVHALRHGLYHCRGLGVGASPFAEVGEAEGFGASVADGAAVVVVVVADAASVVVGASYVVDGAAVLDAAVLGDGLPIVGPRCAVVGRAPGVDGAGGDALPIFPFLHACCGVEGG